MRLRDVRSRGRSCPSAPKAAGGLGAWGRGSGAARALLLRLSLPQAQPEAPDAAGLECQAVLEAERRRRAETGPSGPAAPFPARRTFPGPQAAGASGAQHPWTLWPLHSLFHSKAQVASSPGRFWTIPDLAAHRVSWLPPHWQHTALISPQPVPLLTSSFWPPPARHFCSLCLLSPN